MTVAIGLVCSDGVLVASDSMAADPMTAHTIQKVHALKGCPAIWTAAGSVYITEEVGIKLDEFATAHAESNAASCLCATGPVAQRVLLKNTILPTMQHCYQGVLCATPYAPGTVPKDLETQFLVLAYVNDEPMFLEFDEIGQVNSHLPDRFYAIGVVGPFAVVAQGLMAHYFQAPMPLSQGQLVAYRTIITVCEVAQGSVRPPVQIAIADASGARVLGDDELSEIETGVERWKTLEAETLTMGSEDARRDAQGDLPKLDTTETNTHGALCRPRYP